MYYSAIGLLALLILLIENFDILRSKQAFETAAWKAYRRFLFAVLAYFITDALWGFFSCDIVGQHHLGSAVRPFLSGRHLSDRVPLHDIRI